MHNRILVKIVLSEIQSLSQNFLPISPVARMSMKRCLKNDSKFASLQQFEVLERCATSPRMRTLATQVTTSCESNTLPTPVCDVHTWLWCTYLSVVYTPVCDVHVTVTTPSAALSRHPAWFTTSIIQSCLSFQPNFPFDLPVLCDYSRRFNWQLMML